MFHPNGPTFFELTRQALSSTERGYDLLAPKFDLTPFRTPSHLIDAIKPVLGEPGSLQAGLDLMCGTGVGMRLLHPYCSEQVVGIDFSKGMLQENRKQLSSVPGFPRFALVRGDVRHNPFEDAFDVAVSFGAFGHIQPHEEDDFVSGIARALKPGGRFLFVTGFAPPFWSKANLLLRGFNGVMRVRNFFLKPEFVMYYLTFLLPEVEGLMKKHGFSVEIRDDVFQDFDPRFKLVVATLTETS